jgi:hypothetical protein
MLWQTCTFSFDFPIHTSFVTGFSSCLAGRILLPPTKANISLQSFMFNSHSTWMCSCLHSSNCLKSKKENEVKAVDLTRCWFVVRIFFRFIVTFLSSAIHCLTWWKKRCFPKITLQKRPLSNRIISFHSHLEANNGVSIYLLYICRHLQV